MSTLKAKTIQPVSDSDTLVLRTGAANSLTVDTSGNITVRNEAVIDGINIGLGSGNISSNLRVGTSTFGGANSGINNTAIGHSSLATHTTGTSNVGVGNSSLLLLTTGSNNTALGFDAGNTITVNSQNTCIGSNADVSSVSITNSVAIGYNSSAANSNSVYLGNASTTSLYMGNGSVVAPLYGARAWVTFNTAKNTSGVASTTATDRLIFGSGNVASVQRVLAQGNDTANLRFRVTFTVPMPNENYAVTGMATQYVNGNSTACNLLLHTTATTVGTGAPSNKTTTSFDIILANFVTANANGFDNHYVNIVVFG